MAGAIASLLLFLVPCVFSIGGNDLRQPEIRQSVNGFLQTTLVVDVFHYTEDTPIQFWTRAYEGDLPGPTLRFKPGDVLNITIVNKLLPDIDGDLNTFHSANTTNLHTHGLHVSPEGLADDIFKAVNPGEMLLYSYQIPTNHPWGGTWWYHPHWHGSSTLQQSGGLSGAIIIDPVDPKQTPPEIAAMKEVVMVLQHLCFEHDEDDWNPYDDHLVVSEYGYDNLAINASFVFPNASQSFYVVNGQYQPVVRMVPGEWQLWKVINAGHAINVIFQVPGCDMYTISVDGIWLTAPLQDSYPLFVPAGHIDIAVRCSAAGTYNVTSANNAPYSGDFEQQTKVYDGVLATVVVSGDPVVMNLPTSLPPLPDYLKDLTNITNLDTSYTMLFHAEPGPVPLGTYPNTYYINGEAYTGDPEHYQTTMTVGKPQQWILNDQAGGVNHPFHMHTNQFQIIQLGNDPTYSTLGIVPGQWRDTIPTMDGINILIRFVPDTWTGTIVLHCHMTPHIDLGMMATVAVTDGTTPITLHANSTRGHHKKTKN